MKPEFVYFSFIVHVIVIDKRLWTGKPVNLLNKNIELLGRIKGVLCVPLFQKEICQVPVGIGTGLLWYEVTLSHSTHTASVRPGKQRLLADITPAEEGFCNISYLL